MTQGRNSTGDAVVRNLTGHSQVFINTLHVLEYTSLKGKVMILIQIQNEYMSRFYLNH